MTIAVGICTAPRVASTTYLEQTLYALDKAGLPPSYICTDDGTRGNFWNWVDVASELVKENADYILTMEDDVWLHPKCIEIVEPWVAKLDASGPWAYLSLYASGRWDKHFRMSLDIRGPGPYHTWLKLWGALALLWPKQSLVDLLEHAHFQQWPQTRPAWIENPHECSHIDTAIWETFRIMQRKQYVALPSLAEHIGEVSTRSGVGGLDERRKAFMVMEA